MKPALLVTADGEVFRGRAVGAEGVATGEAVFNTAMTGYQEIVTDPSYTGQVVVMTSSHIGNYGVSGDDIQSRTPAVSGFVMRSMSRRPSSWRSEGGLADYLIHHGVVALSEVDTRRLTRHLRDRGAMPIAMGSDVDQAELTAIAGGAPSMEGQDLASGVSTREPFHVAATTEQKGLVVAVDLGIKTDILTHLTGRGYGVDVVPAWTTASEIMSRKPDGVFVSNGPGDPEPLVATTEMLRGILGQVPVFGICLGHQVLGLAIGARTYKLPFGHHGGNHPVRRLDDGKVEITSQNHGFAVDLWALAGEEPPIRHGLAGPELLPGPIDTPYGTVTATHQNLNDGTLEGMTVGGASAFSVQYHPEAAPGPRDAAPLFDEFVTLIEGTN